MTSISDAERFNRLRLSRTDQVGAVSFHALIQRFGSAQRALEALPDLSRRGGRAVALKPASEAEIDLELKRGANAGAHLCVFGDRDYPAQLAAAEPASPQFWWIGHLTVLERPTVAMVGARIASASGQRFARQLAQDLGNNGYTVTSGLARGIDGASHEGALNTGTAAVLAGGIDDIYPPEHADLYHRIAKQGLLISENEMGRKAQARDFPRRNRIVSGLSLGVIVVEAELRSGSLITARFAAEQGREVFAVPGSPLDPRCRGTNDLLRQGAILCEGVEDVLRELSQRSPLSEPNRGDYGQPPADQAAIDAASDLLREQAYTLISFTPAPCDEIVRLLGAPASHVFAALVELSLAGRVDLLPGGQVCRSET